MEAVMFPDGLSVREARTRLFEGYGLGADGGYSERWVKLKLGPLPFAIPNTAARLRSVRLHDLHHIATGYLTNWKGEGEISAWELGQGCADHHAAWGLNLSGVTMGLLLDPGATFRAWVRGRHSKNLYHEVGDFSEPLLQLSVGELRRRLALEGPAPEPTATDRVSFVALSLGSVAFNLAGLAAFVLPLALLVGALL